MDNEKVGQFILELRKSSQLTQKELAAKLNVSDKAVSKWERGLSYPDIELLSPLSDILGVSTTELLNGERSGAASANAETTIGNAFKYADKVVKKKRESARNILAIVFSALLLIGIIVCSIVDLAISGMFTWSLIPISAILFAFFIFFPVIKLGAKGIRIGMIAVSVLIIPFLYILENLIHADGLILTIGIRMSAISLVYLWGIFALFKISGLRKLIAAAVSVLLAIPVAVFINFTLSKIIVVEPLVDVWDILAYSIAVVTGVSLFIIDYMVQKKQS